MDYKNIAESFWNGDCEAVDHENGTWTVEAPSYGTDPQPTEQKAWEAACIDNGLV